MDKNKVTKNYDKGVNKWITFGNNEKLYRKGLRKLQRSEK